MTNTILRPSPDISWAVELRGLTLISRQRGVFLSIPYPHAGLWAMLAEGTFNPEHARELMALLLSTGEKEADREVILTLEVWREAGLLVRV